MLKLVGVIGINAEISDYPLICNNPKCKSPKGFQIMEYRNLPQMIHTRPLPQPLPFEFLTPFCPFCGKKGSLKGERK